MQVMLLLPVILFITLQTSVGSFPETISKQAQLPPCRGCKVFIESLQKGIDRTAKGKFEGGDAAWEEEKLGAYATSEIRLTEIQEKLCLDVKEGRDQCYTLYGEFEQDIEDWWFNKQQLEPDLFDYFCVRTFRRCCPDQHFGGKCTPCNGHPGNVCSNNGRCKGAGTRKGNGQCLCDAGYAGERCEFCAFGFYAAYKDDTKLLCSKCHVSCEGGCSGAGPEACSACRPGWARVEGRGCADVNECSAEMGACSPTTFCINTEGSFRCLECDSSCGGCTGDGPDMCTTCAEGYVMRDNVCVDREQENRKKYVLLTRYLTYAGLCIATCIILNKNTILAAAVGIAVSIYIAVSEYILNSPHTPNVGDIAKKLVEN